MVKKKVINRDDIIQRFMRIAAAAPENPQKHVCIVQLVNGGKEILNQKKFMTLMDTFPSIDKNIVALQVFYCLKQEKGFVTKCVLALCQLQGRTLYPLSQ